MICPDFAKTGVCSKTKCRLRHSRLIGSQEREHRTRIASKDENPRMKESSDYIPLLSDSEEDANSSSEDEDNETVNSP